MVVGNPLYYCNDKDPNNAQCDGGYINVGTIRETFQEEPHHNWKRYSGQRVD